ncbi:MAG TPA: YCF48-related protein [Blastocatellia bacterium]|nr:YCF48-related protein [Blastocatellia bacterium]
MTSQKRFVFCGFLAVLLTVGVVVAPKPGVASTGSERQAKALQQSTSNLPNGPGVGEISSLTVDPSDSNLLYASTNAGLFKSADKGSSWIAINAGLDPSASGYLPGIAPVVVDPTNSSTLYTRFPQLYRSTDQGANWAPVSSAAANGQTYAYTHAIDSAGTIYVDIATQGLIRSTDHGATFSAPVLAPFGDYVNILAVDMQAPGTLFAVGTQVVAGEAGLFKTTDGGDTWSKLNLTALIEGVAIDPKNDQIVYASDDAQASAPQPFVRKSTDGGNTWSLVHLDIGGPVSSFAIDPVNTNVLYLGGVGSVERSTDAGATWSSQLVDASLTQIIPAINPSDPGVVYLGGRGVLKSSDGGAGWASINTGLPAAAVTAMAFVSAGSGKVLAGAEGSIYSTTDGVNWSLVEPPGADEPLVHAIAVDPLNPDVIYAARGYDIVQSTDGGNTWSARDTVLNDPGALVVAPSDPGSFYAFDSRGVFTSKDATNWVAASRIPFGKSGFIGPVPTSLVVDPTNAKIIYVGVYGFVHGRTETSFFKSTNKGKHWLSISTGPIHLQPIQEIAVAPDEPRTIYAGSNDSLFVSKNGGAKWTVMGNGLDGVLLDTIAAQPSGVVYVGTYAGGAFKSTDGGANFEPIPLVSSGAPVSSFAVDKVHPGVVYVGTALGAVRVQQ